MPRLRLTARTVEAARPPATGRLELFDEGLPGFCIRITANNRRTACVFYRIGSRLRRATLGTLPPLTLADARELARAALRQAALGHDPAFERREAREALTVAGLVKGYIEGGQGSRSEATNGDYGRTLKGLIHPSILGPRAAHEVSASSCARSWKASRARLPFVRIVPLHLSARPSVGAFGRS